MTKGVKHFIRYQFPALLWAVAIYIASSIPARKLPRFALQINDKVVHIGIFFIFGLLMYRALEPRIPTTSLKWKRLLIAVAVAFVYGLSDELHQAFVPGRSLDIRDIAADGFGGVLAAITVIIYSRRKNHSKSAIA